MCKTVCKGVAMSSRHGDHFHSHTMKNADGTPLRVRISGKCKVWKRDKERFRLPIKYGLRESSYIDEDNYTEWFVGYDCADSFVEDGWEEYVR